MGLRMEIIVQVMATLLVALVVGGFLRSNREARDLRATTVDHGLEVMRALAAPCAVPLAMGTTEELDRILASFAAEGDWGRLDMLEVGIVDTEGRVVAHTDHRRFGQRQEDTFTEAARAAAAPISEAIETPEGRQLRLAMPIVSGLRWGTITATLSLDRVDRWVAKSRREALFSSAFNAGVIGLVLFILLSALVLRPMRDLTDAVQRLSQGDFDARVVERRRSPEFALLAGVFNGLARRIASSTRRLEEQVKERTQALEAANAALEELAATDGLTGLANHRTLQAQLKVEVARARREGTPLSMIMLDVDHFKAFNDAHGHPAGDRVLAGIAALLRQRLRTTDLAARYGGEEFAVLLPNSADPAARLVAAKLVAAVREARFSLEEGQPPGRVTISAGVATWGGTEEAAAALLARADAALYGAKAAGRDRVGPTEGAA